MLMPLRGKLIAEIIPDLKQTASGLYIAQNIKEVPHRGTILAIGKPYMDRKGKEWPWDMEKGEIVHFKRKWTEFKETQVALLRDDIIAVEGAGGVRAVRDMVIIKRVYMGKIGTSSLIIPQTHGVQQNLEDYYGKAISIGPENTMGISFEDKIVYHRNEGVSVKLPNGDEYFSLKPRAILARLK